jgi:hypothetical protein
MILPRVFSVDEANALVPLLSEAFERLHGLIARAQAARANSAESAGEVAATTSAAQSLDRIEREIEHELIQLHRLGVILKGLDPCIVDVWSKRGGEWVFLCWRYGEERFTHWHGVNDGFAGRREIDDEADFDVKYVN